MQSAAGSLKSTGPSRSVKLEGGTVAWGIGTDGLALSGHYRFAVLRGAVSFCGITLTSSATDGSANKLVWYDVSSPVPPFPNFSPVISQNVDSAPLIEELSRYTTVLQVRHSDYPLNVSDLAPKFKSLWHSLQRVEAESPSFLEIPRSWTDLVNDNALDFRNNKRQFAIIGPKNSGKSTLSRYLTNRLLSIIGSKNLKSKIFFLELDPGQPEFTPPGCLTLHLISDYNFSQAYAHSNFKDVVKSHHLGYTSPIDSPQLYINLCRDLLSTYDELASPADFLIIDTCGWTKGMGFDINLEILNILDPARTIVAHLGPSELKSIVEVDRVEQNADSGNAMSTITTSGFSASELRSLQMTSYFHQNSTQHLTTIAPFEVKLGVTSGGVLAIGVIDGAGIDLSENLRLCVEGTVVSVNVVKEPLLRDQSTKRLSGILTEEETNDIWQKSTCVGLAIIQSMTADRARLLTPLNPATLDLGRHTVVLTRGRLQIPAWELYSREFQSCPWISSSKPQGIGASYTRFRRNIKRN